MSQQTMVADSARSLRISDANQPSPAPMSSTEWTAARSVCAAISLRYDLARTISHGWRRSSQMGLSFRSMSRSQQVQVAKKLRLYRSRSLARSASHGSGRSLGRDVPDRLGGNGYVEVRTRAELGAFDGENGNCASA